MARRGPIGRGVLSAEGKILLCPWLSGTARFRQRPPEASVFIRVHLWFHFPTWVCNLAHSRGTPFYRRAASPHGRLDETPDLGDSDYDTPTIVRPPFPARRCTAAITGNPRCPHGHAPHRRHSADRPLGHVRRRLSAADHRGVRRYRGAGMRLRRTGGDAAARFGPRHPAGAGGDPCRQPAARRRPYPDRAGRRGRRRTRRHAGSPHRPDRAGQRLGLLRLPPAGRHAAGGFSGPLPEPHSGGSGAQGVHAALGHGTERWRRSSA